MSTIIIGSSKFFLKLGNELYSLLNICKTFPYRLIFFGKDRKKLTIRATDVYSPCELSNMSFYSHN